MANVTLKAPSTVTPGSLYQSRGGTQYTIAAGGLLTIPAGSQDIQDAINQGYTFPSTFAAVTANLTAQPAGIQANATPMSYGLNQVATVATAADGVALPSAVPGEYVTVINDAAKAIQVFGAAGDTINGIASATGIPQPPNSSATYSCVVAGQWRVIPGLGFSGALFTLGSTANGVASNGTTLANGTVIAAQLNRVTAVGSVNGALTLPASVPGMRIRITNANGGNTAVVFPAANDAINSAAANAGFSLAANKTVDLTCAIAGQWDTVLSA